MPNPLPRNLQPVVQQRLTQFPVVAILGARQAGKTTLARQVCPQWQYFDLQRSADKELVQRDPGFFFRQYPREVVLDEAQECPEILEELRSVVDESRQEKGRFLLTGSASPALRHEISESLTGRVGLVELGTLKINERCITPLPDFYKILTTEPPQNQWDCLRGLRPSADIATVLQHFWEGGFPEPVVAGSADFRYQWMENYTATFLYRDIRRLFPNLNTENFRRFLLMLAELSGTILNRSEIGRSLHVSESAIRDYLEIAEGTFLWRNVRSWERTTSKSLIKMPRGYLRDSGLMHHLTRTWSKEQLLIRPKTGVAFEGFIIEEIIKGIQAVGGLPWEYHFYRTRSGAEVDLVLTSPHGTTLPIEIKFGSTTRARDLISLRKFIEENQVPFGMVVNLSENVQVIAERILQIPAGCL